MQTDPLLQVRNVVKNYGDYLASNSISLDLQPGRILGMLGPNGAGKTTLIRIITGITYPDSGQVLLDGQPLTDVNRLAIGYMPEERGLYKKMKVGEQLVYFARLRGMTTREAHLCINYWFGRLEMNGWENKKTADLSKGMQQKVQFLATVLHDPKVIILDEPFSGLDPINANLLKDQISFLKDRGAGIIFSTHRMEQVEEICDDIALINQGALILSGSVQELRQAYREHLYEVGFGSGWPSVLPNGMALQSVADGKAVLKLSPDTNPNQLLQNLIGQGCQINSFREILPSINDIFIQRVESYNAQTPVAI